MATSAISWPNISAITSQFTVMMWLKDVSDTDGTILKLGGSDFTVKMSIAASVTTVTADAVVSSGITTDFGDGNWHHLALAYDDDDEDMNITVDGVQDQTISIIVPDISGGTIQWGDNKTFKSQNLRVYDGRFNAPEIKYYYDDWNENGGNATALPL